jgi:hypothetical protein
MIWSFTYRISIVAACSLLAACDSIQRQPVIPAASSDVTAARSWMASSAGSEDLLYASDGGSSIYVFSYRKAKLVGAIIGLPGEAHTVCSDGAGNVFVGVLAFGDSKIVEYAHGGTQPIETLSAPGEPMGCSVDPTTGNLAAALYSYGSGPGSVAIYQHAQGTPRIYTNSFIPQVDDCAYDDKSNLFVSGWRDPGFVLAELPAGSGTIRHVHLNVRLKTTFFEPIGWDGEDLAIGDFDGATRQYALYRVKVVGARGSVVATASFSLAHGYFYGDSRFWIQGHTIVFPTQNYHRSHRRASQIGYWQYPAGGPRTMETRRFGSPYGASVTVSLAPGK